MLSRRIWEVEQLVKPEDKVLGLRRVWPLGLTCEKEETHVVVHKNMAGNPHLSPGYPIKIGRSGPQTCTMLQIHSDSLTWKWTPPCLVFGKWSSHGGHTIHFHVFVGEYNLVAGCGSTDITDTSAVRSAKAEAMPT